MVRFLSKKDRILSVFNRDVFCKKDMMRYLGPIRYARYKCASCWGEGLSETVANDVAHAMKRWAISKGATHFTHWFFPLNGMTAEKHDSFLDVKNNKPITSFSHKTLIKGEPDASSFPCGNLRSTFEARGYTVWDNSSSAFVKDNTLYIPTAFCSYSQDALDEKTPLLRSMQALDKWVKNILKLFGHKVKNVRVNVGVEQEYYLIDKEVYDNRLDLRVVGRAMFEKCELFNNNQYFGTIEERVANFMKDVDDRLWRLGVRAKTKHNEVSKNQHEIALIFSSCNVALDHNHIVMTLLKEVAQKHGMMCLLHEKPFLGLNGSGKHNNWSISVDGKNIFDRSDDIEFLLFIVAVVNAIDDYQELIRISVASYSNDLRLGESEAPPSIISLYLGKDIEEIIEFGINKNNTEILNVGVNSISRIIKDSTDRNRTSPIAFTGNKFEMRMIGSSQSIAFANTVFNCAVAKELEKFYNLLVRSNNIKDSAKDLIEREYRRHKRIVYRANNYSAEWKNEAKRRGLNNYSNALEAISHLLDYKNIDLFEEMEVLSKNELMARYEVMLSSYIQEVEIEIKVLLNLLNKEIIPSILRYKDVVATIINNTSILCANENTDVEHDIFDSLTDISNSLYSESSMLEYHLLKASNYSAKLEKAKYYNDCAICSISKIGELISRAHAIIPKKYWPLIDLNDTLI